MRDATLDGQARPVPVALAFFLGAFLVTPSLALTLTFVLHCCGDVKLYGLWIGLIVGYTLTTAISSTACACSDWERLSKQALVRNETHTRAAGTG